MRITFHNNLWIYPYLIKHMEKKGYKYNKDMSGYMSKSGVTYIEFETEEAYQDALNIKEILQKRMDELD